MVGTEDRGCNYWNLRTIIVMTLEQSLTRSKTLDRKTDVAIMIFYNSVRTIDLVGILNNSDVTSHNL